MQRVVKLPAEAYRLLNDVEHLIESTFGNYIKSICTELWRHQLDGPVRIVAISGFGKIAPYCDFPAIVTYLPDKKLLVLTIPILKRDWTLSGMVFDSKVREFYLDRLFGPYFFLDLLPVLVQAENVEFSDRDVVAPLIFTYARNIPGFRLARTYAVRAINSLARGDVVSWLEHTRKMLELIKRGYADLASWVRDRLIPTIL